MSETPGPPAVIVQAARLVEGRVASLVERILNEIKAEVPRYGSRVSSAADLGTIVATAVETCLQSLAHPELVNASVEFAWNLGQTRARDGVPVVALLQSYRIWTVAVWNELVEVGTAANPDSAVDLAHAASDFWRFCDRDTTLMVEAYRLASTGPSVDAERKLLPLLRTFLRGHSDPVDVASGSVVLDLPQYGRYAVVRMPGTATADGPVRDELDGMTVYRCPQRYGMSLVVLLGERPLEDLVIALAAAFPGVACGVSSVVDGLMNLGRGNKFAELALRSRPTATTPVLLSEQLVRALLVSRPELAEVSARTVLGPVLDLDRHDRNVLLDTFRAWIDADGSTVRAGRALFCHHNTVLNRLRRLERLTDRKLDRPRDLVELSVALHAVDVASQ
ncbi:helix-turn-helix domain-containing protein [Gordonia sp. (in: high G+C Gram-positive bacteria)]|uniref:helix-turn-helix domain-containing protein n=1 Tax=Gordonia sp. (in: high G+C Gram-positive bacteria) TaxID=84139 RepID=UPI003C753291